MASFTKLFARPRLQLPVLMLFLGAALLPKNSMVQAIQCWEQDCTGSLDCLKTPAEGQTRTAKKDCPGGHCFQFLTKYKTETYITVSRGCETTKVDCLKKEPEHQAKLTFVGDTEKDKEALGKSEFLKCSLVVLPTEGTGPGSMEASLCENDLCNSKDASGEGEPAVSTTAKDAEAGAGAKHLGWNVALVGALLMVSVFPLRTMLLVG